MKAMKKVMSLLMALAMVMAVAVSTAAFAATPELKLSKTSLTLNAGEKETLKVKNNTKGKTVTWSTSNTSIASVTKSGVVRGKAAGNATITAKVGSEKLTCKVTVKQALQRSDFSFQNGTVSTWGNERYGNFVDLSYKEPYHQFAETQEGTKSNWGLKNSYPNQKSSVNLKARGVGLGSYKFLVELVLGKVNTYELTDGDPFRFNYYSHDMPVEKATYTYYENNYMYYQSYYYNDSGKVCMVVWYCSAID